MIEYPFQKPLQISFTTKEISLGKTSSEWNTDKSQQAHITTKLVGQEHVGDKTREETVHHNT